MESFDGIDENLAMVDAAPNGCAIVHSDSEEGIQRLNQEAGKAMAAGARVGLNVPPERAIKWLTSNPAKALGILEKTGTLEVERWAMSWCGTARRSACMRSPTWCSSMGRSRSTAQTAAETDV